MKEAFLVQAEQLRNPEQYNVAGAETSLPRVFVRSAALHWRRGKPFATGAFFLALKQRLPARGSFFNERQLPRFFIALLKFL
jgi:hypothetical protein